jgi:hypothetical protein
MSQRLGTTSQFKKMLPAKASQFGNISHWNIMWGRGMSGKSEKPSESDTNFTLGVKELQRAQSTPAVPGEVETAEIVREDRGVDPYNTSGSFDRSKAWTRVGKR